jgi:hypothetical protein
MNGGGMLEACLTGSRQSHAACPGPFTVIYCTTQSHSWEQSTDKKYLDLMRNGIKRDWEVLHNEEIHNLYCSPNVIKTIT